ALQVDAVENGQTLGWFAWGPRGEGRFGAVEKTKLALRSAVGETDRPGPLAHALSHLPHSGVLRLGGDLGQLVPLRRAEFARLVPLDDVCAEKELDAVDDFGRARTSGHIVDEPTAVVVYLVAHLGSTKMNTRICIVAVVGAGAETVAVRVDLLPIDQAIDLRFER